MTERIGAIVRAYWLVLVGIIAAAAAWGTSTAQIAYLGKGLDRIEAKIDATNLSADKVAVQYAGDFADLSARVKALEARR
jgi:hypothetical protein